MKKISACFFTVIVAIACITQKKATAPQSLGYLRFLGIHTLSNPIQFMGTTVGGLSGIDYDASNQVYYLISDDRSALNPARYYTAKIFTGNAGIDSVVFVNTTTLLRQNGTPYPNTKQDPQQTPDPEALRYDPNRKQLVWTSEGERRMGENDTVLSNPAIHTINTSGNYLNSYTLPNNLRMRVTENGPRLNGVLEGLTFADQFKTVYVSLEEPLYEDGPRAAVTPTLSWSRLYGFDVATQKNTAQYAYLLDPVAHPSKPEDAFQVNGITDILSNGSGKLLVMERSFSTGRLPCTIKIFEADFSTAENIQHIISLRAQAPRKPATKKLLFNLDDLDIYIDNVEGMTFGPPLPNGHKTLLMVSDNNFSPLQKTQFLLFEILP